jgi:hypothetical protein
MIRMNRQFPGFRGAALLIGLALASCIPTRKEPDRAGSGTELGNVIGSIYTADDRPAAGVTVTLYPENPVGASVRTAITDADGKYAFEDVFGDYSLFALDGAGNGVKADSIHASIADSIDLDRLNLAPLASVSGYLKVIGVLQEDPENPVERQAEMNLSNSPFRNKVDPNSAFLWSDLPAGRYWLNIYYSFAKAYTVPVLLVPGQTFDLDTVTLVNEYATDIGGGGDSLKVSTSQLPLQLGNKLAIGIGTVDSLIWTLNGEKMAVNQSGRASHFTLEAGMLRDTGSNVIEMRIYLKDTTVLRSWRIVLDDETVNPWARHAVRGIFMGSEANPRLNDGMRLGAFQVLESRPLSEAEMAFWHWSPVPGGDTVLPGLIKIPMNHFEFGSSTNCGEISYNAEPELFPGDTVTFLIGPDAFWRGMTYRIRKDEDYSSFANLAWFDDASLPLWEFYKNHGGLREIRLRAGVLNVRLNLSVSGPTSSGVGYCTPFSRGFAIGADGIPNEYVAMPSGMTSDNLMLHFRAGLPNGLFSDSLAASGNYVFLDSAGHGVAGRGTDRREVRLSGSEVAELKTLLAPLPAVIPIEWNNDFIEDESTKDYVVESSAFFPRMNFLLSGGRGCILLGEPRTVPAPEAKLSLFQAVEAWLRGHDLL